jgi:hypothetical protein
LWCSINKIVGITNQIPIACRQILAALAVLALMLIAGCARLPIRENVPATPAGILSSLETQRGTFQRYTAAGTISFHGKEGTITLECRWEIKLPDTLQIRIYGPLGFRLGDVLVQGEQVDIFNYWLDQQSSMPLDSLVKQFPGMIALSSARDLYPFPFVSRDDLATFDPKQSHPDSGILVFLESKGQRRLYLDDKYLIIARESFSALPAEPSLEKQYYAYRRTGQSWLPSRVRYSKGQPTEWMEISFDNIKVR